MEETITCQPEIAVLITFAAVSCEVVALEMLKIGLLKPFLIACQCSQHARPSLLDHQVPAYSVQQQSSSVTWLQLCAFEDAVDGFSSSRHTVQDAFTYRSSLKESLLMSLIRSIPMNLDGLWLCCRCPQVIDVVM